MKRRAVIATLGVTFSAGCVGGGSNADMGADDDLEGVRANADAVVEMTDEPRFDPMVLEIAPGSTVAWINETPRTQSVTAYERELPEGADYFASGGSGRESVASILYPIRGAIRTDEAFQHTFETPGEYRYYSIPSEHLGMDGEVVVE